MKRLSLMILLIAVVVAPAQAYPGPGGRGGPDGGGPMGHVMAMVHHLERIGDEIGLSEDQRDAIDAAVDQSRDALRDLGRSLRANRQSLRDQVRADNYDAGAVQALAEEQGQLTAQRIVLGAELRNRIHSVLTDEQRAQLQEMRSQRRHGR